MTGHGQSGVETVGLTVSNRPDTPSGVDVAVRVTMACAVAAVAGVAALTSWRHTVSVVMGHGEDQATAQLVPVTTDGLILAAGLVLLHSARSGRPAPGLARVLLGVGIAVTLAMNALHGLGHGPVGAAVAAWPAVAFVGVSELALWLVRANPARPVPVDAPRAVSAPPEDGSRRREAPEHSRGRPIGDRNSHHDHTPSTRTPADLREPRHDRESAAKAATAALPATRPDTVTAPVGQPATASATGRPRLAAMSDSDTGPDTTSDTALPTVRSWLADDPDMSGAEIARRLGYSARTGQRLPAAALERR